ncbi:MAG: hypothetical protein J5833_01240 [Victivallales bacterium]|nr:hypothetical protein [Victivallales bacterium]
MMPVGDPVESFYSIKHTPATLGVDSAMSPMAVWSYAKASRSHCTGAGTG